MGGEKLFDPSGQQVEIFGTFLTNREDAPRSLITKGFASAARSIGDTPLGRENIEIPLFYGDLRSNFCPTPVAR